MKLSPQSCPECNKQADCIVERLTGYAKIVWNNEQVDYIGETEVDWNSPEAVQDYKGMATVRCLNGHEWKVTVKE